MAGHSHWKQIKYEKGTTDRKRADAFTKLLRAVTAAAREEQNPDFNPRLRTAVEKASGANVPRENIERAIQRASKEDAVLEELTIEAYGPGGTAIFIKAITDNKNRTIAEIKTILKNHQAKLAEPGGALWAFEQLPDGSSLRAKFPQQVAETDAQTLSALTQTLEEHRDVQTVYTNARQNT